MNYDDFDKYAAQLRLLKAQLEQRNITNQTINEDPHQTSLNLSNSQIEIEKQLRTMANDIRALGFYYNKLRASVMPKQRSKIQDDIFL